MHFFNPAPVMPLVEVIAGRKTSDDVVMLVSEVARQMKKTPVVAADMPGFIVNRVARPFYGEALKIVGEGSATITQVDSAMTAAGFPMGPFELMDLIGIDINFAVTRSVFEAFFGEPRYRPHPIQQRMVEAGTLGRKTGQGFYLYTDGEKGEATLTTIGSMLHKRGAGFVPAEVVARFLQKGSIQAGDEEQGEIVTRILAMIMNEAAFALGEGVASVRDIDRAMKLGTNYPKGPLGWADEVGLDTVLLVLQHLRVNLGEDRYRPAPLLWQLATSGLTDGEEGQSFHSPGERGMV
jgi:3-hydroxybutyryl-CoA dehydrogenase